MSIIDILAFVLIGAFIFTRFFGHKMPKDKGIAARAKDASKAANKVLEFPKAPEVAIEGEVAGLMDIKKAIAGFSVAEFLGGAKNAYKYYYKQWNKKDDEALASLLSPQLLDDIIVKFNKLDKLGETPEVKIKEIVSAEIIDARLHGSTAIIDVQFNAKQAENMLDENESIIGSKKPLRTVKSVWTFARPVNVDDPNWEIEAITKPS